MSFVNREEFGTRRGVFLARLNQLKCSERSVTSGKSRELCLVATKQDCATLACLPTNKRKSLPTSHNTGAGPTPHYRLSRSDGAVCPENNHQSYLRGPPSHLSVKGWAFRTTRITPGDEIGVCGKTEGRWFIFKLSLGITLGYSWSSAQSLLIITVLKGRLYKYQYICIRTSGGVWD